MRSLENRRQTPGGRQRAYRLASHALFSPRQRPQKPLPVHVILERFTSIDEDYGNLVVVLLLQLGICIDVHLVPFEVGIALELRERLFHDLTKMASFTRIHHDFVHKVILSVSHAMSCLSWSSYAARNLPFRFLRTARSLKPKILHPRGLKITFGSGYFACKQEPEVSFGSLRQA